MTRTTLKYPLDPESTGSRIPAPITRTHLVLGRVLRNRCSERVGGVHRLIDCVAVWGRSLGGKYLMKQERFVDPKILCFARPGGSCVRTWAAGPSPRRTTISPSELSSGDRGGK